MGKIGQLTGKREKLKNGVKLLLSMFVFGEALSPLKFSKNNAKWLLQLWTIMQLLPKNGELSAKRQMWNNGLHVFSNCYKHMAYFCCWWGAFTSKVNPKKMQNHCFTYGTMQSRRKIHLGTIYTPNMWVMTKKCDTKYSKKKWTVL